MVKRLEIKTSVQLPSMCVSTPIIWLWSDSTFSHNGAMANGEWNVFYALVFYIHSLFIRHSSQYAMHVAVQISHEIMVSYLISYFIFFFFFLFHVCESKRQTIKLIHWEMKKKTLSEYQKWIHRHKQRNEQQF